MNSPRPVFVTQCHLTSLFAKIPTAVRETTGQMSGMSLSGMETKSWQSDASRKKTVLTDEELKYVTVARNK